MSFDWNVFFTYVWPPSAFQDPLILDGFLLTIVLAITAEVIGTLLAIIGAVGRLSKNRVARAVATAYVTYFRGTPVIVQLALIYFGTAALHIYGFPSIEIGGLVLPGAIQAGVITLALNEGAYMTEIIRAGIISVDRGQIEAARAIGMTYPGVMRWIVLPQAVRIVLPPFGNQFNGLIKGTSLVITIGAIELFGAFEQVNGVLYRPLELYLACSFYYLWLTLLWSWVQSRLERRFGRGYEETRGPVRVDPRRIRGFPGRRRPTSPNQLGGA